MHVGGETYCCACGVEHHPGEKAENVEDPYCAETDEKERKRDLERRVAHCKHLSFDGCSPPHIHDTFIAPDDDEEMRQSPFQYTHTTRLERTYPPVSLADTAFIKKGSIRSIHGRENLFQDEEILTIHKMMDPERIDDHNETPIYAYKTENGKYVIQQQATRSCTAGVTAMLIKDHGKKVNIRSLIRRNIGKDTDKFSDLTNAGLEPILANITKDLNELRKLLKQHGSAIISIDGELGNHVIIVDEISADSARIRDPYHGWEITITLEALGKRFSGGSVIQVLPS